MDPRRGWMASERALHAKIFIMQKIVFFFVVYFFSFLSGGGGRNTGSVSPSRKFVNKSLLRSMIMVFVLVFVIFAKAPVAVFPQIYLYTSAVSGV